MPLEIYWIYKFYKMRHTDIVKKRNFWIYFGTMIAGVINSSVFEWRNFILSYHACVQLG